MLPVGMIGMPFMGLLGQMAYSQGLPQTVDLYNQASHQAPSQTPLGVIFEGWSELATSHIGIMQVAEPKVEIGGPGSHVSRVRQQSLRASLSDSLSASRGQ